MKDVRKEIKRFKIKVQAEKVGDVAVAGAGMVNQPNFQQVKDPNPTLAPGTLHFE